MEIEAAAAWEWIWTVKNVDELLARCSQSWHWVIRPSVPGTWRWLYLSLSHIYTHTRTFTLLRRGHGAGFAWVGMLEFYNITIVSQPSWLVRITRTSYTSRHHSSLGPIIAWVNLANWLLTSQASSVKQENLM